MKTEEKIVLAAAGIGGLILLGYWLSRSQLPKPTAQPVAPSSNIQPSPVVSPPSPRPTSSVSVVCPF